MEKQLKLNKPLGKRRLLPPRVDVDIAALRALLLLPVMQGGLLLFVVVVVVVVVD